MRKYFLILAALLLLGSNIFISNEVKAEQAIVADDGSDIVIK